MQSRICEAVEKFTRSDGDVWRLCVRDLLSSEVEAHSPSSHLSRRLAITLSHSNFLSRRSDNCLSVRWQGYWYVFRSIGHVDDRDTRRMVITGSNFPTEVSPLK